MIQIRTTIGGEERLLDTYGDEDVKISISFAEVQDITKKNSSYTQSFKLPGSKNNNDIFNHFYKFQSSTFEFDSRQKFDCQLLLDGIELYNGYLRLNSSTLDKNEVIYDVVFYSEVGNLVANIGDQLLADIDFSNLSHNYNFFETANSFLLDTNISLMDSVNGWENGKLYYSLVSKGYIYTGQTFDDTNIDYSDTTVIDFVYPDDDSGGTFGYMTNVQTPVQWYYLQPSLQIKDIYERIYTGSGYNVKSEFMETDYFKNFYLPLTFSNESVFVGQTTDPNYEFFAEDNGAAINTTPYSFTFNNQTPVTVSTNRIIHEVVTADNFDATNSSKSFKLSTSGTYTFRVTFSGFNSEQYPETVPVDSVSTFFLRYSNGEPFTSTGLAFTGGQNKYVSGTLYLPAGGFVTNQSFTSTFTHNSNSTQAYGWDIIDDSGVGTFILTEFKFEILEGPRQIVQGIFDPTKEFPCCQYKQLDFIASINQFFNMVTVPIPGEPNTLRVEPVIDFIGRGETLDWSAKVDRDSPIKVEPLTDIIQGTLNYMYEEDDGWGNETFTKANNYVFGNETVELNQDYKDKSTDFETEFGAEVDRVMEGNLVPSTLGNYSTSPIYFQRRDREGDDGTVIPEFNPYRTTPKMLFKGPMIPTCTFGTHNFQIPGQPASSIPPRWWLTNVPLKKWRNQNRFTTYPFGIDNFSHYTNWSDDKFDQRELSFAGAETMYNVYWEDYIQDLTNEDNRLVTMSMYFDPFELSQLKYDEKILVDNTIFRINSISNYSLVNQGLADVELIKLTKDYRPHRKIYYTAQPCDSSECDTLYSNSDIQYNLYPFANKYIQTQGGCGCMYLTYSHVPPVGVVDYQPILISLQQSGPFNPNGGEYLIFDSCADCDSGNSNLKSDCLNVYNNIVPEPTPTPTSTNPPPPTPSCSVPTQSPLPVTPTPTSTLTPTPTPTNGPCNCIEYGVSNNNNIDFQGFTYSPCDGSLPIGYPPIPPETSVVVCACENSVKAGRDMVITNLGPCLNPIDPSQTPTPTHTSTPTPTPTHTPTPTPTFGGGTPLDDTICNTGGVDITVSYVDCATDTLIEVVIPAGECAEACACSPITFVGPAGNEENMAITNNGPCVSPVCDYLQWTGVTLTPDPYACPLSNYTPLGAPSPSGNGNAFLYRMTEYSGGTLLGAYYSGPSINPTSLPTQTERQYLADYNNYTRNTVLNGRYPQVFVRTIDPSLAPPEVETVILIFNATDDIWIQVQTLKNGPPSFAAPYNPVYMGGLGTEVNSYLGYGDLPGYGGSQWPGGGVEWVNDGNLTLYPPISGYSNSTFSACTYQIVYSDTCTPLAPTPTPTPDGGTPTPTPTNTVTPTPTTTSTPTPTPSATPNGPFRCTLYKITNVGLTTLQYKWADCETGEINKASLGKGSDIKVCAQTGTISIGSGGQATIEVLGDCTP